MIRLSELFMNRLFVIFLTEMKREKLLLLLSSRWRARHSLIFKMRLFLYIIFCRHFVLSLEQFLMSLDVVCEIQCFVLLLGQFLTYFQSAWGLMILKLSMMLNLTKQIGTTLKSTPKAIENPNHKEKPQPWPSSTQRSLFH